MALSAGEYLSGGQVRDSQGRTVVISETAGAALSAGEFYSGGYLRDADGRMVICQDTLNAALGAGEAYSGGDVRDSRGRVAVAVDTVNSALSGSEQIWGGQVRDSLGRRVIAVDTLGAALSAGEFFSGGNVLDKAGRTVIALEGGASSPYDAAVVAQAPLYWWKLGEPSGTTAVDSAGTNTGTYTNAPTLGQPGIPGSTATATVFNGTTQEVTTATSQGLTPANNVTLLAWFKSGSAATANLIQDLNPQTGAPTSSSNSIYIFAGGIVRYRIFTVAAVELVNPTGGLADGNWHCAVATINASNNMTLFVDGTSVASNAQSAAQGAFGTNGFWRVARGSQGFYSGTLAHVTVFGSVLSAPTISSLYTLGITPHP